MRQFTTAIVGAVLIASAGAASAETLSASKAAVTFGDLVGLGAEACSIAGPNPGPCIGGGSTNDTGYVTVMTTFIKTPNAKELVFDVALQCALVTFTEAKKTGGGTASASAEGRILVRVTATPVNNAGVVTGASLYAQPSNDTANVLGFQDPTQDHDGITYCNRFQQLSVTYNNFACLDDPLTLVTETCELAVSLLLQTLQAHAFNFVLPNLTSGNWKIDVQARALANATIFNVESSARGEAFVGLGSMLVETVRLVKSYDPADGPIYTWVDLN
jgi:hypothetical protein